jgi:hypothetical protein
VVDTGSRALRTSIDRSMLVCIAVYSELKRVTPLFLVPTYYRVMESSFGCFKTDQTNILTSYLSLQINFAVKHRHTGFPHLNLR